MQVNEKIEEQSTVVTPDNQAEPQVAEQSQIDDKISENEQTVASFGKFKSAESLYEGYKQLEKEFTKKCQVLKDLEESGDTRKEIIEKIVQINPNLKVFADELNATNNVGELTIKLAEKLVGKVNEPCNIINDEEFLNSYVYSNEGIINKIVSDYLDSLVTIKVPHTISKGGNSYVSPTYRPRTLDEAGKMAKKFIETRRF